MPPQMPTPPPNCDTTAREGSHCNAAAWAGVNGQSGGSRPVRMASAALSAWRRATHCLTSVAFPEPHGPTTSTTPSGIGLAAAQCSTALPVDRAPHRPNVVAALSGWLWGWLSAGAAAVPGSSHSSSAPGNSRAGSSGSGTGSSKIFSSSGFLRRGSEASCWSWRARWSDTRSMMACLVGREPRPTRSSDTAANQPCFLLFATCDHIFSTV